MVDLAQHFLPEATILSESGETLGWGSLFLVFLVPSDCFSSATVWATLTWAVINPIRDISCQTGQVGPERSF